MPTMQYLHAIYKHKNINNNTYIMGDVFMDGKKIKDRTTPIFHA